MKLFRRILLAVVLLGGVSALVWRGRLISQLNKENLALRNQVRAKQQAAGANGDAGVASRDEELAQLRAEAMEVHKLRNEVNQLRAEQKELAQLRAENQRVKMASGPGTAPAPQTAPQQEYFAKENWTFAGYATPEAALQSSLWAKREGDWRILKASMTAEAWAANGIGPENEQFAAEIEEERKSDVKDTAGFRILERKAISGEEFVLRVHVDGQGRTAGDQNIVLKRLGGEWKVERSYRDAAIPLLPPP